MSKYENYARFLECGGDMISFPDETYREIYEEIKKNYDENVLVDIIKTIVYNNKIAHNIAMIQADDSDINEEEVKKYLFTLKIHVFEDELKSVKKQISDMEKSDSKEFMELYLKQYTYLKKKLLELKSEVI